MKDELYYNLSFEFDYRVLSGRENKIYFLEVKTLDKSGRHLALEMLTLRTTHAKREGERYTCKTTLRQSLSN
jgi:hypothetical protein